MYKQTVVMVTHDARAAAYADRVLFLADGHLVRDLAKPTTGRVLDAIRELGEDDTLTHGPDPSRRQFQGLAMWRVTLTGVLAHRLRYALTALAVLLGVAFIVGTFVLNDTINETFNGIYGPIYQGTSAVVRAAEPFGPVPASASSASGSSQPGWPAGRGTRREGRRRRRRGLRSARRAQRQADRRLVQRGAHPRCGLDRVAASTPSGCSLAGGRRGQVPRW